MNYKFQVGDLVRVRTLDDECPELDLPLGLVTARLDAFYRPVAGGGKYAILIGGATAQAWEYELTKASESNEVSV